MPIVRWACGMVRDIRHERRLGTPIVRDEAWSRSRIPVRPRWSRWSVTAIRRRRGATCRRWRPCCRRPRRWHPGGRGAAGFHPPRSDRTRGGAFTSPGKSNNETISSYSGAHRGAILAGGKARTPIGMGRYIRRYNAAILLLAWQDRGFDLHQSSGPPASITFETQTRREDLIGLAQPRAA